ncbi:hypothetical protein BLNAU_12210 [Blattamonas nauphoetae]|uniref:Uncharacterized protein n=1 Tax=Blattamonas nauphoetae TaxID=2049346 RepID=A0ABQ9XMX9_9EUKA|nr:hypothetical protein BLNAU_12210 [Blattamonas nauphoetae]
MGCRTAFTRPINDGEWELKIRAQDKPVDLTMLGFLRHPLPENATQTLCGGYLGGIGGHSILWDGRMWTGGKEFKPNGTNKSSVSLIQTGWKNTSGKEPAKRWTGMTRWSYEPSASDLTKESMWEERKGRKRLQPDMTRRRDVPIILKESIRFTGLSIKFCLFLFQEQIKVLNLHGYLLSKLRFYTSSFQALTLQPSL